MYFECERMIVVGLFIVLNLSSLSEAAPAIFRDEYSYGSCKPPPEAINATEECQQKLTDKLEQNNITEEMSAETILNKYASMMVLCFCDKLNLVMDGRINIESFRKLTVSMEAPLEVKYAMLKGMETCAREVGTQQDTQQIFIEFLICVGKKNRNKIQEECLREVTPQPLDIEEM